VVTRVAAEVGLEKKEEEETVVGTGASFVSFVLRELAAAFPDDEREREERAREEGEAGVLERDLRVDDGDEGGREVVVGPRERLLVPAMLGWESGQLKIRQKPRRITNTETTVCLLAHFPLPRSPQQPHLRPS
jgi:hypothetical protein